MADQQPPSSSTQGEKTNKDNTSFDMDALWNPDVTPENFVETDYIKVVFGQYKEVRDSLERTVDRRNDNTKLFMPLNYTLIAAASYFVTKTTVEERLLMVVAFYLAGMCMVYLWLWAIKKSSTISKTYLQAIYEYEKKLPSRPLYISVEKNNIGKGGKNRSSSAAELLVPLLFGVLYTAAFAAQLAIIL